MRISRLEERVCGPCSPKFLELQLQSRGRLLTQRPAGNEPLKRSSDPQQLRHECQQLLTATGRLDRSARPAVRGPVENGSPDSVHNRDERGCRRGGCSCRCKGGREEGQESGKEGSKEAEAEDRAQLRARSWRKDLVVQPCGRRADRVFA
jgi:hypothetical protein